MEDLGNYIRNLREKQNLSLEEISLKTKIAVGYLTAMEENRLNDLPSKTYQRLFLRAYLQALGANLDEISKNFKEIHRTEEFKFKPKSLVKKRSYLDFVFIASGVILLIIILWSIFKSSSKNYQKTEKPPANLSTSGISKLEPKNFSLDTLAHKEKLILRLEGLRDSWARIIADGDTVFEGLIQRKQKKEWSCKNNFIISLSKPKAVKSFINNKKLKTLAYLEYPTIGVEINVDNYQSFLEDKKTP